MYPAYGLQLFPPFPRDNRVFVAMPFDTRFDARWRQVIEPGISDTGLAAFRVDIPKTSTSIPADIIRGIVKSRAIFVDVTALDGHRNGNVMYELGIAHSCRQPEEVLLFRSDKEKLLFDVSTIRVNDYAPDARPAEAREVVAAAVRAAVQEIDTLKSQAVESAAAALDVPMIEALVEMAAGGQSGSYPELRTVGDFLSKVPRVHAIGRLLELRLVEAVPSEMTAATMASMKDQKFGDFLRLNIRYRATDFGKAVLMHFVKRWNVTAFTSEIEAVEPSLTTPPAASPPREGGQGGA